MTVLKDPKAISFFILSLAIFTYQNLLGPTFSTLLTGLWQAWVAIPSFLGIGLGLWVSLSVFRNSSFLEKIERFGFHAVFYSFIIVSILLAFFSNHIDRQLLALGKDGVGYIEILMLKVMQGYVPLLLFLVSLPFIFFGFILGVRFSKSVTAISAYRFELVGLLLGSLLCMGLLESWSWASVVIMISFLNFLALVIYEYSVNQNIKRSFKYGLVPFLVLIGFCRFPSLWNLQRDRHLVYRDFLQNAVINVLDTRWKSFAKVQLADSTIGENFKYHFIAIGDGTGLARYQTYDTSATVPNKWVTVDFVAAAEPKKVAVLFAGAGAEIVGLHKKLGTNVETWAVEINSALIGMTADHEGPLYTEFFKKYPSHQVTSDNRKFLETTSEKFDSILYSWSGATVANFSGAILHTTQYSFTEQALAAAINHLSPDGRLIIMGGNKLNIIRILKTLESSQATENLKEKILIYGKIKPDDWKANWDNFIFIYKNGSWKQHEVEKLDAVAKDYSYILNVSARNDLSQAKAFQKMIETTDVVTEADKMWMDHQVFPRLATDDYPFAYRNTPSTITTDMSEWKSRVVNSLSTLNLQVFDGIVWISLIFITLLTLSFLKKDIRVSSDFIHFLGWAPLSSASLLFFLYKAILYFGEPTTAFLIVQTATQLGSLIGLQAALKYKNLKHAGFVFLSGAIVLLGSVFILQNQTVSSVLFHTGLISTSVIFVLVTAYISFAFSFYFMASFFATPEQSKNLGLFWTFETILCGLVSLVGAFLIEEEGLRAFVLTFFAAAVIFILPRAKKLITNM